MIRCLKCGAAIKENCTRKINAKGTEIALQTNEKDDSKLIARARLAICPKCGEVNIYLIDIEVLK